MAQQTADMRKVRSKVVCQGRSMASTATNILDTGQYTLDEIRKYEAIYGRNFVSPGGATTTRDILSLIRFRPDMRVLDVGCGLGGAAFLMAQTFGVRVHGIDLSQNMLQIAHARCQEANLTHAVTFEHADILHYDGSEVYDLAHSRDVFLHIHDKAGLLETIKRCLRPGGLLLFTDYLCRAGARSRAFESYIRNRGYDLRSLDAYRLLLEQAGFEVLMAHDRTADFIDILERERGQLGASRLSAHEQEALTQSWQDKIRRARDGEQRWGVFVGRKPE
jgi:phosphoethanolamine N-methyltransferase